LARRPPPVIGVAGDAVRPLLAMTLSLLAGCAAAPAARPAAQGLAGTAWALEAVVSMADDQPTLRPDDPARYTLVFGANGQAQLRLDCNRASAAWQAEPAPGASAALLVRDLPYVRSYVIESGRLHLALMADGGILRWAPLARP
jgi:hypothetical protein